MQHKRILGTLFIVWAIVQIAIAVGLAAAGRMSHIPYPALYWATTALLSLAYLYVGWRLRLADPRMRVLAILLSAFALVSFPLGTALGAYGLWTMLRRQERQPAT